LHLGGLWFLSVLPLIFQCPARFVESAVDVRGLFMLVSIDPVGLVCVSLGSWFSGNVVLCFTHACQQIPCRCLTDLFKSIPFRLSIIHSVLSTKAVVQDQHSYAAEQRKVVMWSATPPKHKVWHSNHETSCSASRVFTSDSTAGAADQRTT
jgi:hypothetical protein